MSAPAVLSAQHLHRPTVLILSPHFPPSTLAGVHRARLLAKGLPAHGWRPVIVRADPRDYVEPGDPALAALVPDSVEQVAVRTIPAALTRRFGIGDIGLRGLPAFHMALRLAARRYDPDVVLITGSPFYPFVLSAMIRRQLGLPVVLDFQDPWVSDEGARRAKWTKGWASHRIAQRLEPRALRHASAVTSVSERQNAALRLRHASLDALPMAAIPIGGDPDDFEALRRAPPTVSTHPLDRNMIHLSFVGTCMPRSLPVLGRVFDAVRLLRARSPQACARLRLNFVGTSNQPGTARGRGPVWQIAHAVGIGDLVAETPARVPYLEALSILANSDAILLLGSDEPHYTASKIYPALLSGTPYLSLFHAASSAHEILRRAGGGHSFAFASESELDGLVPTLADALLLLMSGGTPPPVFPSAFAQYTAEGVAGDFAALFATVMRAHTR